MSRKAFIVGLFAGALVTGCQSRRPAIEAEEGALQAEPIQEPAPGALTLQEETGSASAQDVRRDPDGDAKGVVPKAEPRQATLDPSLAIEREIQLVAARTRLDEDPFMKTAWIEGPCVGRGLLRKNKNTGKTYLYSSDEAFNDAAADDTGRSFSAIKVGRPWSGDTMIELSDVYLSQHEETGIRVKFWGGVGSTTISLPPSYVKGFRRAASILDDSVIPLPVPDSGPWAMESPGPKYPREPNAPWKSCAEEGDVLCRLHISNLGAVTLVEVIESSGHPRLDEAAKLALEAWLFVPRWQGGVPVPSTIEHRFRFSLSQ